MARAGHGSGGYLERILAATAMGVGSVMNPPSILVTGASGQIGQFVIPRLLRNGMEVIALSRRGAPVDYPKFYNLHWIQSPQLEHAGARVTSMISAGPMALALDCLESCPGIRRAIVFSTTSITVKARSGSFHERAQMAELADIEEAMRNRANRRGVELCLLRPTLVYGAGADENVSRIAVWVKKWPIIPVAGRAGGLRQPVHADDLAIAAARIVAMSAEVPRELTLCGGSTLSFRAMIIRICRSADARCWIFRMPSVPLIGLFSLMGRFSKRASVLVEMLRRQAVDLIFDDSVAREIIDWSPREFAPTPSDFQAPSAAFLSSLADHAENRDDSPKGDKMPVYLQEESK